MTLYARSDVLGTAPSRDHGGCGQVHTRPVENGAPVKVWALTCPQCERHLSHDDQWSATISGIPETPDEKAEREDREKRGQQETTAATAQALQRLGESLPDAFKELAAQGGTNQQMMLAMLTALTERGVLNAPAATVPCANQHHMPATAKFCPECGAPKLVLAPLDPALSIDRELPEPEDIPDFDTLGIRELQAWASAHSVKTARSKADQIQNIREFLGTRG